MRAIAVPRRIESRRGGRDAEAPGRAGEDAARDARFGRQSGREPPLSGVVVDSGRRRHGEHAGERLRIELLRSGDGVLDADRERRRHHGLVLGAAAATAVMGKLASCSSLMGEFYERDRV